MAELFLFLAIVGLLLHDEIQRALAPLFCAEPDESDTALFDFSDITWDWFPGRTAS